MTRATATFESSYGTIRSSWEKKNQEVSYRFEVPANTTATIVLPGRLEDLKNVFNESTDAYNEGENIVLAVGSGEYLFTI